MSCFIDKYHIWMRLSLTYTEIAVVHYPARQWEHCLECIAYYTQIHIKFINQD